MDKTCEFCEERFNARRSDARFCSAGCRQKSGYRRRGEAARETKRTWIKENPEKRQATLKRFAENHPDNGKVRYARLKSDPDRREREREKQRAYYLANREKIIKRTTQYQKNIPKSVKTRYGAKWKHGRPVDELRAEMWSVQDGKCYLCNDPLSENGNLYVHIDHDHRELCCTKYRTCEICRRGLACANCNTLIGKADDNPDRLHLIADNLAKAIVLVDERLKNK